MLKRQFLYFVAAYDKWSEHDGAGMAAAVSYYLALSFFPLVLILMTGMGMFLRLSHSGQSAEHAILLFVENNISDAASVAVKQALDQVQDRGAIHGPVAFVVMLFSSVAGFVELQRAFDRIGRVTEPPERGILASIRMVVFKRGIAFLMLFGLSILVLVVFVGLMVLNGIERYAQQYLPGTISLWRPLQITTSYVVNTLLFTVIYRLLPKTPAPWRYSLIGGGVSAATWELGRYVLASVLIGTKYTVAYGVVGSFIALMLWCYYAVAMLLFGAEYIQVLWDASRSS